MSEPRSKEELLQFIHNCKEEEVTDYEVCKECGGSCCQSVACALAPEDLPEGSLKSIDALRDALMTGLYSIDYYTVFEDDRSYDLCFVRMRNKYAPVADADYTGSECVKWDSRTGCTLDFSHRPAQGRTLKPCACKKMELGNYEDGLSKREMGILWADYNDWLDKLWDEFETDIRKGIPEEEARLMFRSTGDIDDISSGVTRMRLFKPIHYNLRFSNERLVVNCKNGKELLCRREYDSWVWENKSTVVGLKDYTTVDLIGLSAKERATLLFQGWLPTTIRDQSNNKYYLGEIEGLTFELESSEYINHWKNVVVDYMDRSLDTCLEWASDMDKLGYHPLLVSNVEMLLKLYKIEEDKPRRFVINNMLRHILTSHTPIIYGK